MRFTKNIHMKLRRVVAFIRKLRFESSVISYGCQTWGFQSSLYIKFESSVISYAYQTIASVLFLLSLLSLKELK